MLIAILDDDLRRMDAFQREIRSHFPEAEIVSFDNAPAMIAWLPGGLASARLVSLDHDLGASRETADGGRFEPGTGREVANAIAKLTASCPVVVHSSNGPAAQGMIL